MLTIQRASAGSGKTYTLTLKYILNLLAYRTESGKLVLRNEQQMEEYLQHILAITFTNKATNEMKSRVVKSLSALSKAADETSDFDNIEYLGEIHKLTGANQEEIGKAARTALWVVLNNYSLFKISTIDSFFQEILRTFTYEANISDSYQLEIDSSNVIEDALDSAIRELDTKPDKMGVSAFWLKAIMTEEAKKNQQWNPFNKSSNSRSVYSRIRRALMQLESENFKDIKGKLDEFFDNEDNSGLLHNYYKELKEKASLERENGLKEIKRSLNNLEDLILRNNYNTEHLNAYFLKHLGKIASLKKDDKIEFSFDSILRDGSVFKKKYRENNHPLDIEAINFYNILYGWNNPDSGSYYKNWKIYGELIPYLGLIIEIRRFINSVLLRNNLIQLHDTSFLLKKIIGDDDTPFIYERLGNKIYNFLIDEFQDTSQMQWEVMKPLIIESISKNNESLIIGDPKQSIYRFRNAKHTLITRTVPETFRDHVPSGFTKEENSNWRSDTRIVKFNNYFFKVLANTVNELSKVNGVPTDYQDLYSNVVQYPQNRKGKGYVEIRIFEKPEESGFNKEENDENVKDWFDTISLSNVGTLVSSLIKRGYRQKDIGILVNTNEKGKEVVETLIKYNETISDDSAKINFISEESLLISSSKAVSVIIDVLEKLTHPEYRVKVKEDLVSEGDSPKRIYHNWNKIKASYNLFAAKHPELSQGESIMMFLDEKGSDNLYRLILKEVPGPSISAIVEMVVKIFIDENLRKSDAIYISSFQDLVNEYSMSRQNDPASFLEWWYSKGYKNSVATPEGIDAVQIMTIHKSKGLEFRCVILPFATDSFMPGMNKHEWRWVEPVKLPGLQSPPVLPIKTSTELKGSIHEGIYKEYYDQNLTDKINMYYVAFTRAKNELYIFTKSSGKNSNTLPYFIKNILTGKLSLEQSDPETLLSLSEVEISEDEKEIKYGEPLTSEEIDAFNRKENNLYEGKVHFFKDYIINNKRPRLRTVASMVLPSGELYDKNKTGLDL